RIVDSIPRFVEGANYSSSFGLQWERFSRTQLDDELGRPISRTRFFAETGWPTDLSGELILEAGSGAGRFTSHAASTGATVVALDYSRAIDVARRNNLSWPNIHFVQADIGGLPLRTERFDKIYCFGVLQHTPDPELSFRALLPVLRSGGEIVFDIYRLSWKTFFSGKYYLRALTPRLPPDRLMSFVERYVSWIYPVVGLFHHLSGRGARALGVCLGVPDYRGVFDLPSDRLYEMT